MERASRPARLRYKAVPSICRPRCQSVPPARRAYGAVGRNDPKGAGAPESGRGRLSGAYGVQIVDCTPAPAVGGGGSHLKFPRHPKGRKGMGRGGLAPTLSLRSTKARPLLQCRSRRHARRGGWLSLASWLPLGVHAICSNWHLHQTGISSQALGSGSCPAREPWSPPWSRASHRLPHCWKVRLLLPCTQEPSPVQKGLPQRGVWGRARQTDRPMPS